MNTHLRIVPPRTPTTALLLEYASIVLGLSALVLAGFAWLLWRSPGITFSFAPSGATSLLLGLAAVVSGSASIYAWRKAVQSGLPKTGPVVWWRG
jgi:hypothetical protein